MMKLKLFFALVVFCSFTEQFRAQSLVGYLLPVPKKVTMNQGQMNVNNGRIICGVSDREVLRIASFIRETLAKTDIKAEIAAHQAAGESPMAELLINKKLGSQAYRLVISEKGMVLEGGDLAGLFYGSLTLSQIGQFASEKGFWPCLEINDQPDFQRRGVMLDISRDKVPTMETLYRLIDQLAQWKVNEIQLYTEHTFAYKNHKTVWDKASPMTAEEILCLNTYCNDRFIDLVPNQNSFGHLEKWLKYKEYIHLAELPEPGKTQYGMSCRKSISPAVPQSMELMKELYAELLPNFSSSYFNIGCDENFELGVGKSKKMCAEKGTGRVYLDFLVQLKREAAKYDKTVQFWGDIILNHPDLLSELPNDMVALCWGYEENHPFKKQCSQFQDAGIPFYVCPGTSSWGALIGRNKNAFGNIFNAATNGKEYGAIGFLNTNWGDYGHWQPLSVSYPAFALGAALSWQVEANKDINIPDLISRYVFEDPTGISGSVVTNLGNAYLKTDVEIANCNVFHRIFVRYDKEVKKDKILKRLTKEGLVNADHYISGELKRFKKARLNCQDADIVEQEIIQASRLAQFSCNYALAKLKAPKSKVELLPRQERDVMKTDLQNLVFNHQRIWLMRNRLGGLDDSTDYMENILKLLDDKK